MCENYKQIPERLYFCKNHKDSHSGYFVADQPWLKYCKTCALNAALSGRRIQKQLTSQESGRKTLILSVIDRFRQNLSISEQITVFYAKLIAILEEKVQPLSNRIREIEIALRELTSAKENVERLFQSEISAKIANFCQKQAKIIIHSAEIKQQIQNIESNFGNIIETQNSYQFQAYNDKWTALLLNYSTSAINQSDFMASKCKIVQVMEQFYDQFKALSKFTVSTELDFGPFHLKNLDQMTIDMSPINKSFCLSTDQHFATQTCRYNVKPKGHLKLRTNRKISTARETSSFRKQSLKTELIDLQTPRQWTSCFKQSLKI